MRPMLASATPEGSDEASVPIVPSGPEWLHEVKWDGMRVLVDRTATGLLIWSRNENDVTVSFPELHALATRGDDFLLDGNLTIREVTRPVTLKLEINGFGPDPFGGTRAGFSAKGEISRKDFGVSFNGVIPGTNGAVVSDKVSLDLEIEGVLQK